MKPTLQIVDVIATRGHKATGFLEVPGTDVRMPLTLINGVNEGASLLILPVPLLVLDSFVVGVRAEYNLPRLQVTQGPIRREAEYGCGLQYMSWDGWLGRMA
jgi:hypothetical protein